MVYSVPIVWVSASDNIGIDQVILEYKLDIRIVYACLYMLFFTVAVQEATTSLGSKQKGRLF